MSHLQSYKQAIKKLCETHKVKKLYVFGSVLTENFNPESDLDLIVEFENIEIENYADNYFDFKFSLQNIFKRQVDLLEEQAIKNPYFRKSVEMSKQLIYFAPDYSLSKEQINRMEESKTQIRQGNYLTNEQADILADHWLNSEN